MEITRLTDVNESAIRIWDDLKPQAKLLSLMWERDANLRGVMLSCLRIDISCTLRASYTRRKLSTKCLKDVVSMSCMVCCKFTMTGKKSEKAFVRRKDNLKILDRYSYFT